ncbi:dsDNA nuclease domain-containing protein [Paraflavisolibacter sp. H34]|uniref:dsDNA nuclease domain-containing protein n=1 Tax=Huijunlia imazamoxiresistens TaxID=3127457 RepID=UPI003018343E
MGKKKVKAQIAEAKHFDIPASVHSNILDILAHKRSGGAINFRGMRFQLLYAVYIVLTKLHKETTAKVRLEGLEDIDIYSEEGSEFIQVKTSQNTMDAGTFWELGVLQNFKQVYDLDPKARFRLVHNIGFSKGHMQALVQNAHSDLSFDFWIEKFSQISHTGKLQISLEYIKHFFGSISFEKHSEPWLLEQITKLLYTHFEVNLGAETSFLNALFFQVFLWSRERQTVSYQELQRVLVDVRDVNSRHSVNPAIQNGWIIKVTYQQKGDCCSYFDGKAAQPNDIASGLAVERPLWQLKLRQSLEDFDVTVIKSSSGQGKSTLAWLLGFEWKRKGKQVYQLLQCKEFSEANAIKDFLITRLQIGEVPLVIIDGLSTTTAAWQEFAEGLRELPIKCLVTTREEDWYRYNSDVARLKLNTVLVSLSIEEAKLLFEAFKKQGKLHPSVHTWEPLWERIKDKGLLIEYVYLMTQGQGLEERLQYQVRKIEGEEESGAKVETLRLIALADVLNIRIRTSHLVEHLRKYTGLSKDPNAMFAQLEKEYTLKFGDRYIEGLHPVRSRHLVNLLHRASSIQESLLHLLPLLEVDSISEFFIAAPVQFSVDEAFYSAAADHMGSKSFKDIVSAINGLAHYEPLLFWMLNKEFFDEAFRRGGLPLVALDTNPFQNSTSLNMLLDALGPELSENIRYLDEQLKALPSYKKEESVLYRFITEIGKAIKGQSVQNGSKGTLFLYQWFMMMGLPYPKLKEPKDEDLIEALRTENLETATELFQIYALVHPQQYQAFLERSGSEIWGWLKKATDTVTIFEKDGDIQMEYLLNQKWEDPNGESVSRLEKIRKIFPFYKRYCAQALALPLISGKVYDFVIQSSTKHIAAEYLKGDFEVHQNKIWIKVIEDIYRADSIFTWQREEKELRDKTVELAQKLTRLIEAHLELNRSRVQSLASTIEILSKNYFQSETQRAKLPVYRPQKGEVKLFSEETKAIRDYHRHFRNVMNQIAYLFNPRKEHDRNLVIVNLTSARYYLEGAQKGFRVIMESTHPYFEVDVLELEKKEAVWISRLLNTARFFRHRIVSGETNTVIVVERTVAAWVIAEEKKELEMIHMILRRFEEASGFRLYYPKFILQEKLSKTAVIGLQGFDVSSSDDLITLSFGLTSLSNTDIDFFSFVFVNKDGEAIGAYRFTRDYFETMKRIEATQQEETLPDPMPQIPDEKMLETLSGITFSKEVSNKAEPYYQLVMNIWRLSIYRKRLTINTEGERIWLAELEKEYKSLIERDAQHIKSTDPELRQKALSFLRGDWKPTEIELLDQFRNKYSETYLTKNS